MFPTSTDSTFLAGLWGQARLLWRLFRDRQVPGWVKAIPVLGVLYLLSPVDLLPDLLLPGLGELDDLAVILLSLKLFLDLSPPALVEYYRQRITGQRRPDPGDHDRDAIDATYRVLDRSDLP